MVKAQAEFDHFIGGRWHAGEGRRMPVLNPATEEQLATAAAGTPGEVDAAVKSARDAFPGWRDAGAQARAEALLDLATVIDAHAEELVQLESTNVGKPLAVAREELPVCSDSLRFLAGAARTLVAPAAGELLAGHTSMFRREPLGVTGAIAPWNYPLMMSIWKLAPALATGNTVVLKPSEQTPMTIMRLIELADGILPPGVLNVVTGYGDEAGTALVAHPGVAMVSLTGSVATGRRIAERAAESLKQVHLELGGKAPVIVFDDADVQAVADAVRVFGCWNTGQECGSATRVLVQRTVYDDLVAALSEQISRIRTADPAEGDGVEMGPLISTEQRARVAGYVERAVAAGAVIAGQGSVPDGPGFWAAPLVLTGAAQASEIVQEEVFGPVITVQPFEDEAEALELANDTAYGLCASVWTVDGARSLRLARELDFGTVWINAHLALSSEAPWGGFKSSGYGKDMSTLVLDSYTRVKHVMARWDG